MKYTVTLTEVQLEALSYAADIVARLGIGQIKPALEATPIDWKGKCGSVHNTIELCERLMRNEWVPNLIHNHTSFSIHSKEVKQLSPILYDLHQVFRHQLSWDRAIADGEATAPNSKFMMGVSYDTPLRVTENVPLATIEQVKEDSDGE